MRKMLGAAIPLWLNEFTFSKWQVLTYYGQQIFIEQIKSLSHYQKKKKKTHNPTQDGSVTK